MSSTTQDTLLVIIGPSGSGKSTLVRRLVADRLLQITPTWTTRPPRPNEAKDSIEHCFVSQAVFARQKARGLFIDTGEMPGLPFQYGLPKVVWPTDGKVPAIIIRASSLAKLPQHFHRYIIYHIEDTLEQTTKRLLARGQHGEAHQARLDNYSQEVAAGRQLADRVFHNTNNLEHVVRQIKTALVQDFQTTRE